MRYGGVEVREDVVPQLALRDRAVEVGQYGGGKHVSRYGAVEVRKNACRKHIAGDDDRTVEISQQSGSELTRGYGTGNDGGVEVGQYAGGEHGASDASGLNGGVLLGQDDGGVEIGEDFVG